MTDGFSLRVSLLRVADDRDRHGRQRFRIEGKSEAMAMETRVTRSEFYEASRSGYKVSRVIRLNAFLYCGERYLLIGGKAYRVVKAYAMAHLVELTLEDARLKEDGGWLT